MKVKQQALNNTHENTNNELKSLQPALGKTNSGKTTPACHNTAQTRSCGEIVANQMWQGDTQNKLLLKNLI